MANLRVDKIAAPIVKDEFTGSVYFDGTGDYLSMPDSTDFTMGTGDYTIEGWFYFNATGTNRLFGQRNSSAGESQFLGEFFDGHTISYNHSIGGTNYAVTKTNIASLHTWYHIAITRYNQVLHLYVDGVLQSTNTTTGSLDDRAQPFVIGRQGDFTSNTFNGYISNFRICKGHAVYTGNFTPPTRELEVHTKAPKGIVFPAVDNRTVLLACQSSTDATADATKRHAITANGDATAADANPGLFRKTNITSTITENTGSVFFDGSGDYLIAPSSNDFSFDADFTIEFWVNTSTFSVDTFYRRVISTGSDAATSIQLLFYNGVGATSNISVYSNAMLITGTIGVATGDWVHVALSRSGTSMKLFINGIQSGSTSTTSQNFSGGATNGLIVGKYAGGNSGHLNGYISNIRICKGHAVYKSNFVVPTRELEVHPETVFLACYDGENIFADKTGRHIIAAYGDRLSSPTPTVTDSPVGVTTENPGLIRSVDATNGPVLKGNFSSNSQNWLTLPKGTTTQRSRGRGLIIAGYTNPANIKTTDYVQIQSLGNAIKFGDATALVRAQDAAGSSTRAVSAGGYVAPGIVDTIEYFTIATTSNAVDFGNLVSATSSLAGFGNETRGIWAGGYVPSVSDKIDYVTIASLGNAADFGNCVATMGTMAGASSPTRGVLGGGYKPSAGTNVLQYVTIASTGAAIDFGDMTAATWGGHACSSNTRWVYGGGSASGYVNTIQYLTISTIGNAEDFGDLIQTQGYNASTSNGTRGIWAGADPTSTFLNTIQYVTIATTGNALDFGDMTTIRAYGSGTSDSHGGLS